MKRFTVSMLALLLYTATVGTAYIPPSPKPPITRTLTHVAVSISAYNPTEAQCDSDPLIMANNRRVFVGAVALSRDIERDYGLKFGDPVFLKDHGTFIFADRMNKRWKRKVDIFMWKYKDAKQFGRQKGFMEIL